jgi:hypothetical protein
MDGTLRIIRIYAALSDLLALDIAKIDLEFRMVKRIPFSKCQPLVHHDVTWLLLITNK